MRKIIVLSFLTLDGVVQGPGGPKEDTAGGFRHGGWVTPYFDEAGGKIMGKQMKSADLLLGRKTYNIFASYWPEHGDYWPGVNEVTKYVVSKTLKKANWNNSVILKTAADVKKLKKSKGGDIQVHGSSELVQLLLKNDLVDELWLKFFPVVLGKGKRLFAKGTIPAAFKLTESKVTPSGVIFANYKRDGKLRTGTIAV